MSDEKAVINRIIWGCYHVQELSPKFIGFGDIEASRISTNLVREWSRLPPQRSEIAEFGSLDSNDLIGTEQIQRDPQNTHRRCDLQSEITMEDVSVHRYAMWGFYSSLLSIAVMSSARLFYKQHTGKDILITRKTNYLLQLLPIVFCFFIPALMLGIISSDLLLTTLVELLMSTSSVISEAGSIGSLQAVALISVETGHVVVDICWRLDV